MDRPSSTQMTCVLRLDTHTSGWDKSMHKLFKDVQDITYTIDATKGLAYLSGKISPDIILRIRKAKKHAELIHMDYGHVNPLTFIPQNPFQTAPIDFNYPYSRPSPQYLSPMLQPPMSPISQYTYYNRQNPYIEHSPHVPYPYIEQPSPVAYPYYYYPYYGSEMMYSPPQHVPTRDGATGESQCRIM